MPLVKDIIGTNEYDHLTGSGAQSLGCLLPIFDPDGVGQNPLDFFPFHRVRFSKPTSTIFASLLKYRSGADLRFCVKIAWLREMYKFYHKDLLAK